MRRRNVTVIGPRGDQPPELAEPTDPPVEGIGRIEPASARPAYAEVAERVAGVLRAAEEAAEQIRRDARVEVERAKREAEAEGRARAEELARRAEEIRSEADEYARDIRLAVDAYANQRRRDA